MQSQILEQLCSFATFILVGFLIGLLFDSFRILRKTFKTSDLITGLEDILFWILTGLLTLFSIFKFNNGNIRVYIIFGIFIGITVYMLVFSKYVVNMLTKIINYIKKIVLFILKLVLYPVNIIKKIILFIIKPVRIYVRKVTNKLIKVLKTRKRQNKSNLKKDFA